MTAIYSDIIEIPGLELSKSTTITNVSTTSASWTYNADPRLCTGLTFNFATGLWGVAGGSAVLAYAAASKPSGATTGDIKLLPYVLVSVQPTAAATPPTPYQYTIQNSSPYPTFFVRKQAGVAISPGSGLYYSAVNDWVNTNSSTGTYIGTCAVAAVATDTHVLGYRDIAAGEVGGFVFRNAAFSNIMLPHPTGTSYAVDNRLILNVDGNYTPHSFTPAIQSIQVPFSTIEGVPSNATVMRCLDGRQFSFNDWKLFLSSATNNMLCKLTPMFSTVQYITNSDTYEVYQMPSAAPFTRQYTMRYRIQQYGLIPTLHQSASPSYFTGSPATHAFIINVPGGLSWNYIPPLDNPTGPYNPPTPIDRSSTHILAALRDTADTGSPLTWYMFAKTADNPATATPANTHATAYTAERAYVSTLRTSPSGYATYCRCQTPSTDPESSFFEKVDHGVSDAQTLIIDPTRVYSLEKVFLEGGTGAGTMRLEYRLVKVYSSGVVPLTGWVNVPRVPWYTNGSTAYIKFPFTLSLSSFGITAPDMSYRTKYRIEFRQYYISVSPYNSFSTDYGSYVTSNMNEAGGNYSYSNGGIFARDNPLFCDVSEQHLKSCFDDAVEFKGNVGRSFPLPVQRPSYTGNITLTTTAVDGKRCHIQMVSTVTPAVLSDTTNNSQTVWLRVRRKRDGRFVTLLTSASTVPACLWSYGGTFTEVSMLSTTPGTGGNAGFNVGWTSRLYWVDKPVAANTEEYEAELLVRGYTTPEMGERTYWCHRFIKSFTY